MISLGHISGQNKRTNDNRDVVRRAGAARKERAPVNLCVVLAGYLCVAGFEHIHFTHGQETRLNVSYVTVPTARPTFLGVPHRNS